MIIGITGTNGAGKGVVAEYLSQKHHFVYLAVKQIISREVLSRGKMVNRDTLAQAGSELRAAHGPTYLIEQVLGQAPAGRDVVIESIRTKEEVAYVKTKGAMLWAVDADPQTRHQRTQRRDAIIEPLSFEVFMEHEKNDVTLKEVMALADERFDNGDTKEKLFQQIDTVLAKTGHVDTV